MLNAYRIGSVVLLAVILPVYAQQISPKQAPATPGFSHVPAYYYKGDSRVNVWVALDEFHIQGEKGHAVDVSGLGLSDTIVQVSERSAIVRLKNPVQSLAHLNVRAQAYSSARQQVESVAYTQGLAERSRENRRVITHQFIVKTYPDISIDSLETKYGFDVVRSVPYDPDTYVVKMQEDDFLGALDTANALYEFDEVEYAEPIIRQHYSTRFVPNDPYYSANQWHLNNVGKGAPFVDGHDANITAIWDEVTGDGVNILIVDEGIAVDHEDLVENARPDLDYDYFDDDDSPLPASLHGSASAGIAVARGNNGLGVTGAAFEANLVGIRLLKWDEETSNEQIALALSHLVSETEVADQAHVNSNSWGPSDKPFYKDQLDSAVAAALANGVTNGRNGKGVLYVWAGGNGRIFSDRASYDPYTSSRYTITVAASGGEGTYSNYSEPGPCVLVNAPSSFSGGSTTSTATSGYTTGFGGTSSAAPLVAGVLALMLDKNFALTWRDVQQILVETSTETDITDPEWFINGGGHLYNENYGFGRINALAAVNAAASWTNLPAALSPVASGESSLSVAVPDDDPVGIERTTTVTSGSSFSIEHVELTFNINHPSRGDLNISLTSPDGTTSVFAITHKDEDIDGNITPDYSNWTFGSVAHWGEDPNGTWTLHLSDGTASNSGTLTDWTVTVYGTTPTTTIPTTSYVYVDNSFDGYEQGSITQPFNTLAEGMAHLTTNGTLDLSSGTYLRSPTLVLDQPMTLDSTSGGTVTIE